MDDRTSVPAQETHGLPLVYLEVPHQSGLQGAATSKLLNTGLTAAEAHVVSEPAPVQYATTSQKRARDLLGVTWILACITAGVLFGVYEDAADGPYPGEADWALVVLGIIAPFALVFSFYPHWQGWRHKKRHKAWLARFIASWPLREKLASVESIPDVWQRITVGTMADTLVADREAILLQGGDASGEVPARLLSDALTAVGTYARAATQDPDLQAAAQQAVDRFSELAGRRREHPPLSDPPSVPGQQLRRRRNGPFNDVGSLPE
ncbi:hypothetical protein [Arthrobacter sp. ISL-69]|uniref:hypothetical protein n=1 Tax=Arthrobacter sp. ISL-69 TaxID=2819113 RepID=UPI001BEC80DB|nr:hypothetical protein [Arthrobacter sp. ISL-69]MBT2534818.1 hypothetical protein [Arthrobacter sp. ISL-69]